MAKGGKTPSDTSSSRALEDMATQLFQQSDPLRSALFEDSAAFLGLEPVVTPGTPGRTESVRNPRFQGTLDRSSGEPEFIDQIIGATPETTTFERTGKPFDVSKSPLFNPISDSINTQAEQTRQQILSTLPQGGAQQEALADAAGNVGRQRTDLAGKIAQGELDRAFQLATGAPLQASVTALGSAGNIQGNLALAEAQQNAAAKEGLGAGAGSYLGSKPGGG